MKHLELTTTNGTRFIVDELLWDSALLFTHKDQAWRLVPSELSWHSAVTPNGRVYIRSSIRRNGRSAKTVRVHRLLMCALPGEFVDHVNGDSLDNRISNLRVCTQSQNLANSIRKKRSKSGYRGVFPEGDKWIAKIMCDGTAHRLGRFSCKAEAAKAYDEAARSLFGEFATLNFQESHS